MFKCFINAVSAISDMWLITKWLIDSQATHRSLNFALKCVQMCYCARIFWLCIWPKWWLQLWRNAISADGPFWTAVPEETQAVLSPPANPTRFLTSEWSDSSHMAFVDIFWFACNFAMGNQTEQMQQSRNSSTDLDPSNQTVGVKTFSGIRK